MVAVTTSGSISGSSGNGSEDVAWSRFRAARRPTAQEQGMAPSNAVAKGA